MNARDNQNLNMDVVDTYDEIYAFLLDQPLQEHPADPLTYPENVNSEIYVAPTSTATLSQVNVNTDFFSYDSAQSMEQMNVGQSHVEREVPATHDLSLRDVQNQEKRPHKKRKRNSEISDNEESLKDYYKYFTSNEVEDVEKLNKRESEILFTKKYNKELEQELKAVRTSRRLIVGRAQARKSRLNKKELKGSLEDDMVTLKKEMIAFQKDATALEAENQLLKDEVDYYECLITNNSILKEQFLGFYNNNSYPSLVLFQKKLIGNPSLQHQNTTQTRLEEQQNNSRSISALNQNINH